ncbi:hypothetical protein [Streptacidiphilus sp. MAP12-16]|uniref:hypothetical protein n=1 Tax=Streptacidiphilus sp. MAP12-16 TaxID=3156300 RepID=UPI003519A599
MNRSWVGAVAALLGAAGSAAGLSACSSSSTGTSLPSAGVSTFSPATASFSGEPPSALASLASAAQASVQAAASSAQAAASAFSSSVSAESSRAAAAARAELAGVSGTGNAVADVGLTGINRSQTGGLHAVVVTITNNSGQRASYAVKIDFDDNAGNVVDSAVVGAENLDPGKKAQPIAFSTKPADQVLIPKVAQAQRY